MAYVIAKKKNTDEKPFDYLPKFHTLRDGTEVILDYYDNQDEEETYRILKDIVDDGQSYPQETMETIQEFKDYYLSHDAFVVRQAQTAEVLGAFYIKPNFPGRCSHLSNAGFIVKPSARRKGIARFMAQNYLYMARDLGYKASMFNLVFVNNEGSLKLWRDLGFVEIGRIPNAGNLKGVGFTDAVQFYYDFATLPQKQ
ncbi:uncharacterized protein LOC144351280 [Saccoglossus kowalevskii]